MEYSLTIFKSIFDNKTHRKMKFDNWSDVEKLFLDLSKKDGYKPKKGEFKEGSPLISPAVYKEDEKRRNVNVTAWGGWAALDIDDYDCSFEEVKKSFENIRHILYNSSSSTEDKPKFRVVLPFKRLIKADEIKHLWYALNSEFNSFADPQTKDLSRMYYVPAKYPGAYSFFTCNEDTEMIDVDALMRKHPFTNPVDNSFRSKLSEDLQNKLAKYRKEKLTNRDIKWNSYHDCPFVSREAVSQYKCITESGWYHAMYKIMVSIVAKAIKNSYPIQVHEVVSLCKEIDNETGGWYKSRPLNVEAQRAIDFGIHNF